MIQKVGTLSLPFKNEEAELGGKLTDWKGISLILRTRVSKYKREKAFGRWEVSYASIFRRKYRITYTMCVVPRVQRNGILTVVQKIERSFMEEMELRIDLKG